MSPSPIVRLGDPRLRQTAVPVTDLKDPAFGTYANRLIATLEEFRERNGFGRALAAPQIGVPMRCIAVNLGHGSRLLINPEIVWTSVDTFTLWDDCLSFPQLLVRVRRHESVSVRFLDEQGERREWLELDRPTSELLQHEIDHLDGVLAVDRAIGRQALVDREAFAIDPEHFKLQVDYVIEPTT